jgi:hypothetical protein
VVVERTGGIYSSQAHSIKPSEAERYSTSEIELLGIQENRKTIPQIQHMYAIKDYSLDVNSQIIFP